MSERQHRVVLDEMGSLVEHLDLPALYASWDAQLVASGETFDTLVFVKRRVADALHALRACGVTRVDETALHARSARQAADDRGREEEAEQLAALWQLVDDAVRIELRALASRELSAFLPRMSDQARQQATEAAARRLLGERFPGRERRGAELARLRESAVA